MKITKEKAQKDLEEITKHYTIIGKDKKYNMAATILLDDFERVKKRTSSDLVKTYISQLITQYKIAFEELGVELIQPDKYLPKIDLYKKEKEEMFERLDQESKVDEGDQSSK